MKQYVIALTCIAFLLTSAVTAKVWNIDVTDIPSMDLQDDPNNTIVSTNLGPGTIITGIGWDLTIGTIGTSWQSETVTTWSTDAGVFVFVTPGSGNSSPGTNTFSSGGIIDLNGAGIGYITNINGNVSIQFFESYDDYPDSADAKYLSGTYSVEYTIPEPTLILGACLLAGLLVRRK